jgi:hypothetical protein
MSDPENQPVKGGAVSLGAVKLQQPRKGMPVFTGGSMGCKVRGRRFQDD